MLIKTHVSLAVTAALLLGGCSLAPSFMRPDAPVAATWNADVPANATGTRKLADTPWQAFFPDARLQALIAASFEYNRDLRIAVARVEEARGLYGVQRADRLPNFNLSAGRNASLSPAGVSVTGNPLRVNRYDVNVGLASFELDFWGRVANLSDAARNNYLATEEAQRSFRLSLISEVANAYFTVLEMEDRAMVAEATVKARSEGRDILIKRREVGIASELDFLQADGAYELARADLANIERQRAAAVNALLVLVGQPTLHKELPNGRRLTEQGVVADLDVDLPTEVLLRRPDVIAAEYKLIAANANIGAARAAFLPRFVLLGNVGTAARDMSNLFDDNTRAWSFTPSITLPIFDWGRNSNNLDVAEARKVIAVAEYEKTIQQAFREVADLLVAREQLGKQLTALEAAEKTQTQRLRLADARYKAGIANYLEVLDAQREAYTAQQSTIQVRRVLLSTAANLYKALGGSEAYGAAAMPLPASAELASNNK